MSKKSLCLPQTLFQTWFQYPKNRLHDKELPEIYHYIYVHQSYNFSSAGLLHSRSTQSRSTSTETHFPILHSKIYRHLQLIDRVISRIFKLWILKKSEVDYFITVLPSIIILLWYDCVVYSFKCPNNFIKTCQITTNLV